MGELILYVVFWFLGFGIVEFLRISPRWLIVISFLLIIFLPPLWVLGLLGGLWIAAAFFVTNPEPDKFHEEPPLTLRRVFFSSLWCFAGFLLTLTLVWRLKSDGIFYLQSRETIGWVFLVWIEVCFFRFIVLLCPEKPRQSLPPVNQPKIKLME